MRLNSSGVITGFLGGGGLTSTTFNTSITLSVGTDYDIELSTENGTDFTIKVNDSTATFTTDYKLPEGNYTLTLGRRYYVYSNAAMELSGSIDLKYLAVNAGGVPVFSGNKTGVDTYTINGSTVTIPYTLSKTGSKIVNYKYRTRVTNLYNAQGYAPYYTLSDSSFTLPMGEVYGMIERRTSNTNFDGQWITSSQTISTTTAIGSYTLDFSNYLPNDSYNYEVLLSCTWRSYTVYPSIATITDYSMNIASGSVDYSNMHATSTNCLMLPVTASRQLTLTISNQPFLEFSLSACAYRRVGDSQ